MSKQDTITKLGDVVKENLPHILTGVASVGVVATAIETGKAVLKIKELDEAENDDRKASDKAKSVVWAIFPAAVTGALTIACIVSSDVVHTKRYTSLLGAFVLTKSELEKHKDDLKELLGPDKAREIEHKLAEKRVKEFDERSGKWDPLQNPEKFMTSAAYVKHKVVDLQTGFEFEASYADLLRGEAEVAKEIARSGHATLEYFYGCVTEDADYPEIATRIYWDQEEYRHDMMNLHISGETSRNGELYYTIEYEYSTK